MANGLSSTRAGSGFDLHVEWPHSVDTNRVRAAAAIGFGSPAVRTSAFPIWSQRSPGDWNSMAGESPAQIPRPHVRDDSDDRQITLDPASNLHAPVPSLCVSNH